MKTPYRLLFILFFSLTFLGRNQAQSLNRSWEDDLTKALQEFMACGQSTDQCREMVGKTFEIVYNIKDFYNGTQHRYLSATEISSEIDENSHWKALGPAYDQNILAESQELANEKKPVLAVYRNKAGEGLHVAMLLPGELKPSGSWGMRVPNAASFFSSEPDKSFVGQGLSYAFSKQMLLNVTLYARQ